VRATVEAESHAAAMQIVEMEEYVGLMGLEAESDPELDDLLVLLRQKKAAIDMKGVAADEQIGEVQQMLDNRGIPEVSLSDNESDSYPS
jgi:hypothetical protein